MTRLVSVGNVVVDVVLSVPALPERGGDVMAQPLGSFAGGSFNTMVAARRQGMATAYGGAHGTGPHGDLVRTALAGAGIEVLLPPSDDRDTGHDIVLVDAAGERTFVTVFGAEAALSTHTLAGVTLAAGGWLHVSGYGLLERTNARALSRWLPSVPSGVTVLVDPGPLVAEIPAIVWAAVVARADWLSCNQREATVLSGHDEPQDAARALAADGTRVVVRRGAGGCLLAEGRAVTAVAGYPVGVVDTTGAGDAHVGILVAALAAGADPVTALRRANAGAALAVTRHGGATSPTSEELDVATGAAPQE